MNLLTYVWHDCFIYSNGTIAIIFDFWKDPLLCGSGNRNHENRERDDFSHLMQKIMAESKQIYVVVSHHHKDHYTKKIFDWSRKFPGIKYILSKDVAKYARHILTKDSIYSGIKPDPENVFVVRPGEVFCDESLKIEAFDSTDIGNSYAVTVNGIKIFHAGDLNAWIWKDESTESEISEALKTYESILDKIVSKYPEFDMAMFPVDSRLGTDYFTGAKIFLEKICVRHFFPMHFGLGDTSDEQMKYQLDAADVRNYANPSHGECICLQAPFSSFIMP